MTATGSGAASSHPAGSDGTSALESDAGGLEGGLVGGTVVTGGAVDRDGDASVADGVDEHAPSNPIAVNQTRSGRSLDTWGSRR